MRFILFSKKRYTGKKVEFNPYKYATITMGVSDKRRDFCTYVKMGYRRILDQVYDMSREWTREELVERAIQILQRLVEDLLNNRVPLSQLKVSKLLNDEYAVRQVDERARNQAKHQKYTFGPHNLFVGDYVELKGGELAKVVAIQMPKSGDQLQLSRLKPLVVEVNNQQRNESFVAVKRKLKGTMSLKKILDPKTTEAELEGITHPHVRLARKMYARDPGTAPKSGSRVSFVFVETSKYQPRYKRKKELQWTKVEDYEYAKQKRLKTDNVYYLERQMEKGWSQIIDALEPGKAAQVFEEAYYLNDKANQGLVNIDHFLAGQKRPREIKLGQNMGSALGKKKPAKKKKKTGAGGKKTLLSFFGKKK